MFDVENFAAIINRLAPRSSPWGAGRQVPGRDGSVRPRLADEGYDSG
jgi:hypothetical protein